MQQISISLSSSQIKNLDKKARQSVLSRSATARQALVSTLDLTEERKKK